jgi:hypothetical protein
MEIRLEGNDEDEYVPPRLTVAELDARLDAANVRRAEENARLREENRALEALLERKHRLVARYETVLAELRAEQDLIHAEVRRLLTPEEEASFPGLASR